MSRLPAFNSLEFPAHAAKYSLLTATRWRTCSPRDRNDSADDPRRGNAGTQRRTGENCFWLSTVHVVSRFRKSIIRKFWTFYKILCWFLNEMLPPWLALSRYVFPEMIPKSLFGVFLRVPKPRFVVFVCAAGEVFPSGASVSDHPLAEKLRQHWHGFFLLWMLLVVFFLKSKDFNWTQNMRKMF